MNKKHLKGWMKHGDFILLDIFCLQLCFVLGFWLIHGYGNPYSNEEFEALVEGGAWKGGFVFINETTCVFYKKIDNVAK